MKAAICALSLLLAACSHVELAARSDSRAPASTTGATVQIQAARGFAALLLGGMLIAGAAEDLRNPQPTPVMQADREVSEQDCTRPIELGANLRCR